MNLDHFFNVLANNSSRNFKIDELQKRKDNEMLKQVIELALNPFIQFYIRKIPLYTPVTTEGKCIDLKAAIDFLGYLSSRQKTGNEGIDHLQKILSSLQADDAKVIERIISKDLKCGVSDSTVNKVWPGLIPEYPCMLASAYDQKLVDKVSFPAYAQLKLDGMRFNAIVRNGSVEFRTRNGKQIQIADPSFGLLFIDMAYNNDVVFDGELLVGQNGKILDRKTGNGILNKAVKGTQSEAEGKMVCATLWDMIPLASFEAGVDNSRYEDRLNDLGLAILLLPIDNRVGRWVDQPGRVDLVTSKTVNDIDEARLVFDQYLVDGQEGIILKTKDMIWENKRSKKQIKFKNELECDLKIVGVQTGTGKYEGLLGAITCQSQDGVIQVSVGSGFTDAERKDFISQKLIGRIVTVKYNARITNKQGEHSLFLPTLVEVREDKDIADSSKDIK